MGAFKLVSRLEFGLDCGLDGVLRCRLATAGSRAVDGSRAVCRLISWAHVALGPDLGNHLNVGRCSHPAASAQPVTWSKAKASAQIA